MGVLLRQFDRHRLGRLHAFLVSPYLRTTCCYSSSCCYFVVAGSSLEDGGCIEKKVMGNRGGSLEPVDGFFVYDVFFGKYGDGSQSDPLLLYWPY